MTLGIPTGAAPETPPEHPGAVLIANPNSNRLTTEVLAHRLRRWMTSFRPDTDITHVVGVTAVQGPRMITTPQALTDAARHVCDAVDDVVGRQRVDAVIVGGFGDPGVDLLRSRLNIPVIGIGEAAVCDAARSGLSFGIATTTGDLVEQLTELVARCSVSDRFTGVEVTTTGPLRLAALPDACRGELAEAVQRARERGADRVIIGGGPLSSATDHLEQLFPGVIVDPVNAAARWAEQITRPSLREHPDDKGIR